MLNVGLAQSNKQSKVPQPSKGQHTSVSQVLFNFPQPYQAELVHEVFCKKAGKENTEEKIAITMIIMTINNDNDDEGSDKYDIMTMSVMW